MLARGALAAALFGAAAAHADSALQAGTAATFTALPGGQLVSNAYIDVDGSAQRLDVKVNATGGDVDLFLRYGSPFPDSNLSVDLINREAHYHSVSSTSNEAIAVLPSSNMPLRAGRWYIDVVNGAQNPSDAASGTLVATVSSTPQLGSIQLDFGNPVTNSDPTQSCDDSFWTDATPATPIGGNTGTTLGQQRQFALQYAANELVTQLQIPIDITVHACGAHLGGDANSAILAHAAPLFYLFSDPDLPLNPLPKRYTWYAISAATRLAGTSACGLVGGPCDGVNADEIEATFNEDIGTSGVIGGEKFYLGFDAAANPGHQLDFVTIAMHEMTHGLGFFGLVNMDATQGPVGAKAGLIVSGNSATIAYENVNLGPYDDIYDDSVAIVNGSAYTQFLGYEVNGAHDAARAAALTSGPVITQSGQYNPGTQTGLRYADAGTATSGANANAGLAAPADFPSLYAPCDQSASATCAPQPSSSLSHTIQSGDMMNAFYSGLNLRSMGLAVPMLGPVGWSNATAAAPAFAVPFPSNWFDVAHNGHGFDFQVVGHDTLGRDVYLLTFYTYDASGKPEWYQATGSIVDGMFLADLQSNGSTLYRLVYDNSAQGAIAYHADSVAGSVVIDFNQASQAPACRNADRSGASLLGVMDWSIGTDVQQQWCVQPVVTLAEHAAPDLNGHWYSNSDAGWGFELLDVRDAGGGAPTVVVYAYYPGANGQPTWATASGKLANNTFTATLQQVANGYCRTCAPPAQLSGSAVGTITLTFDTSGAAPHGNASISASFTGGSFSRNNDPIVPLSVSTGP